MNEQRGFTLWFTGLSGSGKTTISELVEHELRERERPVEVLDGDVPAPEGAELNDPDGLSPNDPTIVV